jgi:hypothetical protein
MLSRGATFSSAVGLSVEGAPQGLTAALNPASVTGTSTTLTLSAAASVGIRTYLLTIRASAPGVPEQRLTLPVRITGI